MAIQVPCSEWMEWFLGASEVDVIDDKNKFFDEHGNFKNLDGKLWYAGAFDCPSVADMREEVRQRPQVRLSSQECPLKVVDRIDIGNYQAEFKTNDQVMVQLASNLNCLENGSPSTPADCGRLVSAYSQDCTQGPAAAFGVPAASLLRAHYTFKRDGVPPSEWGQTSDRQLNLIDGICGDGNYCGDCINGKARLFGQEKPVTAELMDEVAGQVKVGLHSDAQVVFRRGPKYKGTLTVLEEPQYVDQVCSATLCIGFADRLFNPPQEQLDNLCRALLRAAYEGAYLAAILRKRKLLLLTLVGGASFRNPINIILEEIKRAHQLYATHPASELQEVRLVLYEKGAKMYQEALDRPVVS